jgi:tetratricopeptide (TPR) repeat protein
VFGKVGWLGALAALEGSEPFQVEERLHTLERREFLRRDRRSQVAGERQYAFRHVLVRDVAYGQLPRPARADRHRRAAEWLQGLSPDRAEDRAELLAHHWQAAVEFARAAGQDTAGLAERARLALRDAGDRVRELNGFSAAARWYVAALELWPPADAERPRLLLQLGTARCWAEQAGAELLEAARDGLLAQGDREGAAEAERLLSLLLRFQGQAERAIEHDRRAVALLEGAPPSGAKVTVLGSLASGLLLTGQPEAAIRVGRQALAMAEALGLDRERAIPLDCSGYARVASGDRGGLADLEQAVAIAVQTNVPGSATNYANLADALIALGDLARGVELHAKAYQAAERFGLPSVVRNSRAERAFQDYWQGRWDAALDGADQFIAEAQAGSPHHMERACRLVRGLIRLARGDLPGALADAATAVELATQIGDADALLAALAVHARALLANRRDQQASARANDLLAELAKRGPPGNHPRLVGAARARPARPRTRQRAARAGRHAHHADTLAAGRHRHRRRPS